MFKRSVVVLVVLMAVVALTGIAMAQNETKETMPETTAMIVTPAATTPVAVGNKVCPVSGDVVGEPGKDTVEYNGKVYNLCCPACKATFLADPEKYVDKVEKEMGEEKAETPAQEKAETADQEKAETTNEMAGMKL